MHIVPAVTIPLFSTTFDRIVLVLAGLTVDAATLAILAVVYTVKRRLGLDVFPSFDMLPDAKIEAVIRAGVSLVRGWLGPTGIA